MTTVHLMCNFQVSQLPTSPPQHNATIYIGLTLVESMSYWQEGCLQQHQTRDANDGARYLKGKYNLHW